MQRFILPSVSAFCFFLLASCASNPASKFYTQLAPTKYPKSTYKVKVFNYGKLDLDAVYKGGFSDCIRIGRSSWIGPDDKAEITLAQANKVGADCVILTCQFRETRHSTIHLPMPTTRTVRSKGFVGGNSYTANSTIQGTDYVPVNVTHHRYDWDVLFLKYTGSTPPLQEKTKADFPNLSASTHKHDLYDENYDMEVHQAGDVTLAFVKRVKTGGRKSTKPGDLKLVYTAKDNRGIYMTGDRAPNLASVSTNQFGHFEVTLVPTGQKFAFAKR